MPTTEQKPARTRIPFTVKLNDEERRWLELMAKCQGVSSSDALRMLIHRNAADRGWKKQVAA